MQARAQAVALFGRCRHDDRTIEREFTDAPKRIGNHLGLERKLALVGDVRIQRAPTSRVPLRLAAIRARLDHFDGVGPHHLAGAFGYPCAHPFAGHRAGHKHHTAIEPGQHTAAGHRPLDLQFHEGRIGHHNSNTGNAR